MTGYGPGKIYGEGNMLHNHEKKVRSNIPNFQGSCPTIEQYQAVLKQSLNKNKIDIQKIFAKLIGTQDKRITPKKHWKEVKFVCCTFVDDTDLVQSADTPETDWTVVKDKMHGQVDHWEGGLRASGGALREDKSFWYLINFKWKDRKWEYKTIADTPGELTVPVDQGHRETIQRTTPSKKCCICILLACSYILSNK